MDFEVTPEYWLTHRSAILAEYSPFNSIRTLASGPQQEHYGTGVAQRFGRRIGEQRLPMTGAVGEWLLEQLAWDSDYFGSPTYRLFTGLFGPEVSTGSLVAAASALRQELSSKGPFYAFSVVAAEDTALLQALSGSGWRLIETRLNFYCPVAEATLPSPVPVRLALASEAELIGRISAAARNNFDRFHADPWFGPERADAFLARYAQAAVEGNYAAAVLLPNEIGVPIDSFLAIGDVPVLPGLPGSASSRVLLTAVGPQNRGWHVNLVAEAVRRAASLQHSYVLMTTQATNKAVFRTCEKLGFRLGSTSHVLACFGT
jgi:dTDP-4-amino-4,6-dideoxy-D-galactose acyltransferase